MIEQSKYYHLHISGSSPQSNNVILKIEIRVFTAQRLRYMADDNKKNGNYFYKLNAGLSGTMPSVCQARYGGVILTLSQLLFNFYTLCGGCIRAPQTAVHEYAQNINLL